MLLSVSIFSYYKMDKMCVCVVGDEQFFGFQIKNKTKYQGWQIRCEIRLAWSEWSVPSYPHHLCTWSWRDQTAHQWGSKMWQQTLSPKPVLIIHFATCSMSYQSYCTVGARPAILKIRQSQSTEHWTSLRLQGKLACSACTNHPLSHSMYSNLVVAEDILIFSVKARL